MANPTQIHLVRHGEVENPQNLYYGRLPGFPLSEEGHRQAQAAADALRHKPLAAIFSSPLPRATETAEHVAAAHDGLTVCTSDLLIEVYVSFEGWPISEVRERGWDVYTGSEPPYERPVDVLERMQQFVAEVRQQYAGQHVVAVTHGDPLAFLMLWAKGMPVTPVDRQLLYREHYLVEASITTFTYQTTSKDEVPGIDYMIPYQIPEPK